MKIIFALTLLSSLAFSVDCGVNLIHTLAIDDLIEVKYNFTNLEQKEIPVSQNLGALSDLEALNESNPVGKNILTEFSVTCEWNEVSATFRKFEEGVWSDHVVSFLSKASVGDRIPLSSTSYYPLGSLKGFIQIVESPEDTLQGGLTSLSENQYRENGWILESQDLDTYTHYFATGKVSSELEGKTTEYNIPQLHHRDSAKVLNTILETVKANGLLTGSLQIQLLKVTYAEKSNLNTPVVEGLGRSLNIENGSTLIVGETGELKLFDLRGNLKESVRVEKGQRLDFSKHSGIYILALNNLYLGKLVLK